ncbi:MAG: penicillin-binding protein activator [Deltaproteobacteria bacterium]|nr:penicillin-binding protein activator [Deltaproteobacteria bacterium]
MSSADSAHEEVPDYKRASTDAALLDIAKLLARKKDFKKAMLAYQRLIVAFPESAFKYTAYYEAGYLRWRLGEVKEAKAILADIANSSAAASLKAKAEGLVAGIDSALLRATHEDGSAAIGVVLALKGIYAPYGEAALKGALLGSGIFAPPQPGVRPDMQPGAKGERASMTVYVRDVGDEPAKAVDAVKELSSNANVLGIVGPLLSANALDAAREAQNDGVPIITLSQREGAAPGSGWAFRNSMTLASQASALAAYAVGTLGLKRFAVIYPQNAYGEKMSSLFGEDAQRLGASVVAVASYEDGATDFSAVLKQAFNVAVKTRKEGRRTIKEYEPKLQADAVFIPDYFETVGMLLPYLEYLNIKDIQLLGTSGWNSARFASAAGKAAEGAVFVDAFFAGSKRQGAAGFTADFEKVYSAEPGVIEAAAYDAALALRSLIAAKKDGEAPAPDRSAVRDGLKSLKGIGGAAGEISFNASGEAVKKLFFLTVKNGQIIEAGR